MAATDLKRSMAYLYQGELSRFLHWCCGRNIAPCEEAQFAFSVMGVETTCSCNKGA